MVNWHSGWAAQDLAVAAAIVDAATAAGEGSLAEL
jgi:hypothetical protein